MKFHIIVACLCLVACFGCTKTIYSAQENMSRITTKQNIVNTYGLPTEKRIGEGIEEWLYNYGTVYTRTGFGNSNTNASVYGSGNSVYGNASTTSVNVTNFTPYSRYLKFTIDDKGNVLRWESQGVELATKEKAPGRTVLLIFGCLALGVGLGIATSGGDN